MTVTVQNTAITNTFDFWRNRTNELAYAMSTKAVTVESTAATGNAAITGSFSATNLIANGYVTVANTTSNIVITIPSAAVVSSGNYFLNANGSWVIPSPTFSNGQVTTSGTSAQVIDSWSLTSYRGAEYLVNVKDNSANNKFIAKMIVVYDGASAHSTEYASITTNTAVGAFSVDSNTTHVRLNFTPTLTSTAVTYARTLV